LGWFNVKEGIPLARLQGVFNLLAEDVMTKASDAYSKVVMATTSSEVLKSLFI